MWLLSSDDCMSQPLHAKYQTTALLYTPPNVADNFITTSNPHSRVATPRLSTCCGGDRLSSTSSAVTYILDNTHHALHSTHSWRKKPCRTCRLQRHSFHASPTSDTHIHAYIRVLLKPTAHLYHHRALNGPTIGRGQWRTIRLPRVMRALWERQKAADSMKLLFYQELGRREMDSSSILDSLGYLESNG